MKMDHSYARAKLTTLLHDLDYYTGEEFWRQMSRIAAGSTGASHAEGLAVERDALATFARDAFDSAFDGCDWHGADIQERGVDLGLLRAETYDPEKHAGPAADCCEVGDTIYVYTDLMRGES